ncbi:hypothetical protein [Streptomyces sp. FL07-04A]|uniref:hypothetical protein n=1 Tax=Streptomyces sp. FL07-04A TaxID=3028658 RepID=UPI0029B0AE7F|nr:hypothetical protein [Streptomyces sp. FL07-04A]MDX3576007.1 hypothetical protein [Streptomyces sp. FL07-04A]
MASDITIPGQRTPALYYAATEQSDGTTTITRIDRQPVDDPRERALCRALLLHALAELDRAERPHP